MGVAPPVAGRSHFRALVMAEMCIWGSVIAAQLAMIGVFYHQRIVK
jgi:hypothetical protein